MPLPFTIIRTFQTKLSVTELFDFARDRKKVTTSFFNFRRYTVKIEENRFSVRLRSYRKNQPAYPKIVCEILSESPTRIKVKIIPRYFVMAFFLMFVIVFTTFAFMPGPMTINGVYREPEFMERITFALFGAGLPLVFGFFMTIWPVRRAEDWIREKLSLEESW